LNFYKLEFLLYVYSLNGEFLRIEPLADQLSFCSNTYQDGHKWREFQTSFANECEIDLNDFLKKQNNTLEFYEIFMKDPSKPTDIFDVPILISNIENPLFPNLLNNQTGLENAILTRRFFLIDNVSGIQGDGSFIKGSKPTIIRYPTKIKLVITLIDGSGERIYPPYLEIFYKSKLISTITTSFLTKFSFFVDYDMNISRFLKVMLGFMITLIVLIFIAVYLKFNVWLNTHPKLYDSVSKFCFIN
jgi:meckelin